MDFIAILLNNDNVAMHYELLFMLVVLSLPAAFIKNRKYLLLCWAAVFLFFVYIHRALLTFLVAGIWFFIITGVLWMFIRLKVSAFAELPKDIYKTILVFSENHYRHYFVIIMMIMLIQLSRINIAIDYDSLRYGLRSDVLLSDGGLLGFFKGMGLVNTVYVYPKGYELITLPLLLINDMTYGYALCFNVWVLIAVIYVIYKIVFTLTRNVLGRDAERAACFAAAAASLMPGITNMAVTAKSDLITVLCQLVFIYCVVAYVNGSEGGGSIRSRESKGCVTGRKRGRIFRKSGETFANECDADGLANYGAEIGLGTIGERRESVNEGLLAGLGTGALILSLSFKPTSVIFSSAVGTAALVFFVVLRIKPVIKAAGLRAFIPACVFTGIITLRTYLISGQPFTSIFTGLFSSLGMELKYPFRQQNVLNPDNTSFSAGRLVGYFSRILHFLFCPTGEDMEHVFMAWGGIVFLLLLITALILFKRTATSARELASLRKIKHTEISGKTVLTDANGHKLSMADEGHEKSNAEDMYGSAPEQAVIHKKAAKARTPVIGFYFIYTEFFVILVLSLISLWLLYQVDGNYFQLLYALTAIAGSAAFFTEGEREIDLRRGTERPGRINLLGSANFGTGLVCAVMIFFTAVTGWNGACGFTPVDFVNRGYYNHEVEYGLKNPLNWDRHTRVVAFGYEPECYKLRGRVESWVDIDGSGGNVYLTSKLDVFKEYLSLTDIDYIYADIDFLNDNTNDRRIRASELFGDLMDDGCFEDVVLEPYTSGKLYCRIDKERTAESWQEDMGDQRRERIAGQREYCETLGYK